MKRTVPSGTGNLRAFRNKSSLVQSLYFRAGADLLVPMLREAYRVNDDELVHRPSSLGFRAAVALGVVLEGDD